MDIVFREMAASDRKPVIDLFNYYVENSFAAFPEMSVSYDLFDMLFSPSRADLQLVARDGAEVLVGFGILRPYKPFSSFSKTAEITCFIAPGSTRRGVGANLYENLMVSAGSHGITTVLACISSRNTGSLAFHRTMGFRECGRFRAIGEKHGESFDEVWMQLGVNDTARPACV